MKIFNILNQCFSDCHNPFNELDCTDFTHQDKAQEISFHWNRWEKASILYYRHHQYFLIYSII